MAQAGTPAPQARAEVRTKTRAKLAARFILGAAVLLAACIAVARYQNPILAMRNALSLAKKKQQRQAAPPPQPQRPQPRPEPYPAARSGKGTPAVYHEGAQPPRKPGRNAE